MQAGARVKTDGLKALGAELLGEPGVFVGPGNVHEGFQVIVTGIAQGGNHFSAVERFVLSAKKPSVLFIPPGYANGFMSLTDDLKLMFFSTSTLEESLGDDIRFDSRLWDVWQVPER